MKQLVLIILLLWGNFQLILSQGSSARPLMLYGDTSRVGVPYSKDPHVVNFKGRYLMYHSIPPMKGEPDSGWNIGIAESKDLMNWTKVGEITPAPEADYEKKGLCAPGALVKDGKVHLFIRHTGMGRKMPSAMPYRMTAFISEGIRRIRFSIRPEIGLVGVP